MSKDRRTQILDSWEIEREKAKAADPNSGSASIADAEKATAFYERERSN